MLRLKRLTGNLNLKTEGQIKNADRTPRDIAVETLWRPFAMAWDPILVVYNTYLALIYGKRNSSRGSRRN